MSDHPVLARRNITRVLRQSAMDLAFAARCALFALVLIRFAIPGGRRE